jgi:hypothetical protein
MHVTIVVTSPVLFLIIHLSRIPVLITTRLWLIRLYTLRGITENWITWQNLELYVQWSKTNKARSGQESVVALVK